MLGSMRHSGLVLSARTDLPDKIFSEFFSNENLSSRFFADSNILPEHLLHVPPIPFAKSLTDSCFASIPRGAPPSRHCPNPQGQSAKSAPCHDSMLDTVPGSDLDIFTGNPRRIRPFSCSLKKTVNQPISPFQNDPDLHLSRGAHHAHPI